MVGDPAPSLHQWLDDACRAFSLRDKEVARYLDISLSLWRKIRHGVRALQYVQRRRFHALLREIAEPAEYARWMAAEPTPTSRRLPHAA